SCSMIRRTSSSVSSTRATSPSSPARAVGDDGSTASALASAANVVRNTATRDVSRAFIALGRSARIRSGRVRLMAGNGGIPGGWCTNGFADVEHDVEHRGRRESERGASDDVEGIVGTEIDTGNADQHRADQGDDAPTAGQ